MIRFRCPCGRRLQAAESNVGQPARCPLCDRVTVVPASDEPDAPPRGADPYREPERDHGDYQREPVPPRPSNERDEPYRRPYERDEDYDDGPRYRRGAYAPMTCADANSALWMGLAGLFCCQIFSIFALINGIKALNQINNSHGELTGYAQAIIGIVLGALGTLGLAIWLLSLAMGM